MAAPGSDEERERAGEARPGLPLFTSAGPVIGPESGLCPWCGFPIAPDALNCAYCKWTRRGTSIKRQAIAYTLFVVLMFAGFGLAVWFVGRSAP